MAKPIKQRKTVLVQVGREFYTLKYHSKISRGHDIVRYIKEYPNIVHLKELSEDD